MKEGSDCAMNHWRRVWLTLSIFTVFALLVSGCSGEPDLSTLTPKGSAGEEAFDIMKLSTYIMIGVMAVVVLIYFYVIIRFRKRKNQTGIPKQVEGSTVLEIVWTSIPILLLLILAVPTVMKTFALSEDYWDDPNAIQLKVTAHQYWWEFEYPQFGIKTAQDLYIPVGKKIAVQVTSADVIHSFWIPALAGKIDTNPGAFNSEGEKQNVNTWWFDAKEPGVYKGKCAELCGPSHALMDFKVVAVPQDEFDAWVNGMKAQHVPATDLAKAGEEIFNQSCIGCHAVDSTDPAPKPGPNLDGFGDRQRIAGILPADPENFKKNLKDWISDPDKVKPQVLDSKTFRMPAFKDQLTDDQMDALVEYLSGLKVSK